MYTAKIENANGSVMILTGNEVAYQVVEIIGLNPPQAQINTALSAGIDGARYNSARLEMRNIVLTVKINGDVEVNRQNLYKYFRTKEWCKFFYTNRNRDVYIDGYVESVACDLFTNDERAQISILCPDPYFRDLEMIVTDISSTIGAFEFPFAINIGQPIPISVFDSSRAVNVYNDSEAAVGVIIDITIAGSVNTIEIRNTQTGESFVLDYAFIAGDQIAVNTNKGQKSVTLLRSGQTTNLFTAMRRGSVFFQLAVGDNLFIYLADSGANNSLVDVVFSHSNIYRGV